MKNHTYFRPDQEVNPITKNVNLIHPTVREFNKIDAHSCLSDK